MNSETLITSVVNDLGLLNNFWANPLWLSTSTRNYEFPLLSGLGRVKGSEDEGRTTLTDRLRGLVKKRLAENKQIFLDEILCSEFDKIVETVKLGLE